MKTLECTLPQWKPIILLGSLWCGFNYVPGIITFAIFSLGFIVSSCWTLVQTFPIIENQGWLSTEVTVVCWGAIALQTVFMAGNTVACIRIEAVGTRPMAHILVQKGLRHALWGGRWGGRGKQQVITRRTRERNSFFLRWQPIPHHRGSLDLSVHLPRPCPTRAHSPCPTSPELGFGTTYGGLIRWCWVYILKPSAVWKCRKL